MSRSKRTGDGVVHRAGLLHDGLRCYSSLHQAAHPICLTHLIRRCKVMAEVATRAAAVPLAGKDSAATSLISEPPIRARQEVTPHGLAVATGRLEAAMDRLLDHDYHTASNRRLAKHLGHKQ